MNRFLLLRLAAVTCIFSAIPFPAVAQDVVLPPAEAGAAGALNDSPRHGEWITVNAGGGDQVDAYIVFPERRDRAPVVVVVHEIFGLTDWVRSVADRLAAEGFIAVAPDFLSGKGPGGKGSRGLSPDKARGLFAGLDADQIARRLDAVADHTTSLKAARKPFAVIGFCWGGGVSFSYATRRRDLAGAVVYYGVSPAADSLKGVRAPVLGLYGGDDARITSTVSAAEAELKKLGRRYEYEIYPGAGHAFLRQQTARDGANLAAGTKAWGRTLGFLREVLE